METTMVEHNPDRKVVSKMRKERSLVPEMKGELYQRWDIDGIGTLIRSGVSK
jgi:hypothetical protein